MFPKVKFVLAKESFDSDLLLDFSGPISGGWDWSKIIFDSHPKLAKYIKNVDEEEKEMIIKKYTSQFRKDNYEELQSKVKLFQKQWDKVNDDYMETLQEVIEINWPKSKKIIGYITICPICPRFLETWSFAIYYKTKISEVNLIVAHETLHFIYFKKWKEVFPKSDPKTFDSPHLEWHLSEILATVILNNTPKIQKIIKIKEKGYQEYRDLSIRGYDLIEHFELMYKKHLDTKTSFGDFLKLAYKEIKKYKNLLKTA